MSKNFNKLFCDFMKDIYGGEVIPLHQPIFEGNERQYLVDCIDSNFVSSVGEKVTEFEKEVAKFVGVDYAVATTNGTSALHVALELSGVGVDDEVITQPLTFVATCNAITYCGASPIFVDVDRDTMGLSPLALETFLQNYVEIRSGRPFNKISGRRIAACVPMHTFGFPCRIKQLVEICEKWEIPLIEDAAESLGSYVNARHTGSFGLCGIVSFNGNKIITSGGGGMIITNDLNLARRAKHITTTAKVKHTYEFAHDEIGYNYRMPNLNAALGCAQLERLNDFLSIKFKLAKQLANFFDDEPAHFVKAIHGNKANHWLNTIILTAKEDRDDFLNFTNERGVMTRPIWQLMSKLPMFKGCQTDGLKNSLWLEERVVNIPSSVPSGSLSKLSE